MSDPLSFSIELDGLKIETARWGAAPDEAPSIVLLHEGLGSVALWRDFPQHLAQATGLGVLAYSRLGYGRSDSTPLPRPLTYMHEEADRILGRVLDAAGIRRAILLGHSDGASIAAIYAGSRQDFRVRGLILIAPHFFVEDVTIASIEAARTAYTDGNLRPRLARYHNDVDTAFWGWNGAWLDPGFRTWDITDHLPHIRVPVLLLQGDADPYGTTAQLRSAEAETTCPVETVLLPGAGHAPQFEAPEPTLDAVRTFVAQVFAL
jgi:pimeloyl-ACP methyl ester carboxylesterase